MLLRRNAIKITIFILCITDRGSKFVVFPHGLNRPVSRRPSYNMQKYVCSCIVCVFAATVFFFIVSLYSATVC